MRIPKGSYHRIKTYPDGKRVRLIITPRGRIISSVPVHSSVGKVKTASRTKTGRKLAQRRRRIGL